MIDIKCEAQGNKKLYLQYLFMMPMIIVTLFCPINYMECQYAVFKKSYCIIEILMPLPLALRVLKPPQNLPRCNYTRSRGLDKPPANSRAVSNREQVFDLGLKIAVQSDLP
jgi:hypothetical protein